MSRRFKTLMIRTTEAVFAVLLITLFLRADFLQFKTPLGKLSLTTAKNTVIVFTVLCLPAAFVYLFKKIKERSLFLILLTLAFVLMIFSCFHSSLRPIPGSGKPFAVICVYFFFFVSLLQGRYLKQWNRICQLFAVCFAVVCMVNLAFHFHKGMQGIIEAYPFWPGKNLFALFLVLGLFLMADRFLVAEKRGEKVFLAVFFLMGLTGLGFTYSRAAFLSFLFGAFVFLLMQKGAKRRAGIIILLGAVFLILLVPKSRSRLQDAFYARDYNSRERIAIWKGTCSLIKENPITGVGAGQFSEAFFQRDSDFTFERAEEKRKNYYHSHNLFLQIAVESGLPAALLLLAVYAGVVCKGFLMKRKGASISIGLLCALAALFVYSLFDSTYNARFTHASMFHINLIVLLIFARLYLQVNAADKTVNLQADQK